MEQNENRGFRSRPWLLSYRTSTTLIDGRPVDMLHDFYIPALQLATRYDRVAGYFRSTSLAAASQGFSSFVSRKGKMRLIVGADLDPDDVRAILQGDSRRLESRLDEELEQPETWPEQVRNGVTLLAWMVAHGHLEVRVAFRLHKITGEPISFDNVDDGYVHEKWFIMQDEFGNRMYGSGTLNESKTAFVLNAENFDLHCEWRGETDRLRVEEADRDFENLWNGRVAHIPVLTLPEAVRRRLVQFAEGVDRPVEVDGSSAATMGTPVVPSVMERLQFAVLREGPRMPGGRYVGMETAPAEPWPHQKVVVRRLVETWPYSYLLCDEVGLGKTIEAGLAFRSLYLSGLAKRILIAAPAGLTLQWHRQMASKMLMSFGRVSTINGIRHEYVFPHADERPAASMYEPDLIIISTGLLSRRERLPDLRQAEGFDIVLVDEAHAARRSNPNKGTAAYPDYGQLYLTLQNEIRPKTKSLWLATATPMQIHPVEVYDLLALTNRVGIFQFDPTITQEFYNIIEKLVHDQEPSEEEWTFLRQAIIAVREQDPFLWRFIEQNVMDGRIRSTVHRWLEMGIVPRGRDRERMMRLIFCVAPLSRVMMRHTRKLLEVYREKGQLRQNLAQRHVLPVHAVTFSEIESRIYRKLDEYCKGLSAQIQRHGDRQRQIMNFLLSFLRLRFASSMYAFQETMKRRLQKVEATLRHERRTAEEWMGEDHWDLNELILDYEEEDDATAVEALLKGRSVADLEWEKRRITDILHEMESLPGDSSKMRELLRILDRRRIGPTNRFEQTVVFTRFYDTLVDIVNRLRHSRQDMRLGTYSGQGASWYDPDSNRMVEVDREEVKERFLRGEIDILICTDAAAEGLNLQTANMLINFDLGWNPMKIEQRIGRIDRIGQKYEHVYVVNICYAGSEEEMVYRRLLDRLTQANLIVGTQQISLLPVEPDEFRQLAEGLMTYEELEKRSIERLTQQNNQAARMEMRPEELFEIYQRLSETSESLNIPVDLQAIWNTLAGSATLRSAGCVVREVGGEAYMEVHGIPGVPDGTVLTISRKLYEEGLTDDERRVHFASYGDPVFEALLAYIGSWELPSCVRKVSVDIEGMPGVSVVGFAAVCRGPGDVREIRLIRSWRDLQNISLAEEETLRDSELDLLRKQLAASAWEEFEPYLAVKRIERENLRAAWVQELLNSWIVCELLPMKSESDSQEAPFWPALRAVEQLAERNRVLVSNGPLDILQRFRQHLAYECTLPTIGDRGPVHVPGFAVKAAAEAAQRAAESMKTRRSEMVVGSVVARLRREAQERRRWIESDS